jgi:hypothetical protein
MKTLVLLLGAALGAPATTFYVTVSGLGGEADYTQRFAMWARDIDASLKKAGGDANIATLEAPTREAIRAKMAALASQATAADSVVLMLIGHGTFDGVEYKFNVPGPDISASELASLLDRIPARRQCVAVMTSSSGGAIEVLRKPGRVVIAATRTGSEKNATIFARYWAEALRDPAADSDKTESISAQEAFTFAQRKTKEFFDAQKRLATEHAVLEDSGGLAATFPLIRLGANAAAANDPAKRPLLDRKEAIEQAIDQLKFQKAALPADEYKKRLATLLLDLARTQEALDK